jgi:hypothetical protein
MFRYQNGVTQKATIFLPHDNHFEAADFQMISGLIYDATRPLFPSFSEVSQLHISLLSMGKKDIRIRGPLNGRGRGRGVIRGRGEAAAAGSIQNSSLKRGRENHDGNVQVQENDSHRERSGLDAQEKREGNDTSSLSCDDRSRDDLESNSDSFSSHDKADIEVGAGTKCSFSLSDSDEETQGAHEGNACLTK